MRKRLTPPVFALLDDNRATHCAPSSRLYTGFVRVLSCTRIEEFGPMLTEMQCALTEGLHAVGLFSYELGVLDHAIGVSAVAQPLAQVLLFTQYQQMSEPDVSEWLKASVDGLEHQQQHSDSGCAGIAAVEADVDHDTFCRDIARIHAYLTAGDAYQINYTYRLRFTAYGSMLALYQKLRARQAVPYGALIALPDGQTVLSFSPELFLAHAQARLVAQPMKGTARASGDEVEDALRAAALALDEKNRAENLMIVDLLRNDLGQIACTGTVTVPSLFQVDTFGSVLQMTSTITAKLHPEISLRTLFSALFPCGSITGAPKRRSMQIIEELEHAPRGLYTGAIGWFEKAREGEQIGDFSLSVPIRTLVLGAESDDGTRVGEMGVGAGIVHDSRAEDEYRECQLKASFLVDAPVDFHLFETMYATRETGVRHLERHLERLRCSAAYFGFAHEPARIDGVLIDALTTLQSLTPHRLRLALAADGTCTVRAAPLSSLPDTVQVLLAGDVMATSKALLRHKISLRAQYDLAWQTAESQGAFDMLFENVEGELTEGARSNLFVRLAGRWYTPPLDAGLLPGIMRGVLLDDATWNARERRLTRHDLIAAEEIVVCNAVRGVLKARLTVLPVA